MITKDNKWVKNTVRQKLDNGYLRKEIALNYKRKLKEFKKTLDNDLSLCYTIFTT